MSYLQHMVGLQTTKSELPTTVLGSCTSTDPNSLRAVPRYFYCVFRLSNLNMTRLASGLRLSVYIPNIKSTWEKLFQLQAIQQSAFVTGLEISSISYDSHICDLFIPRKIHISWQPLMHGANLKVTYLRWFLAVAGREWTLMSWDRC